MHPALRRGLRPLKGGGGPVEGRRSFTDDEALEETRAECSVNYVRLIEAAVKKETNERAARDVRGEKKARQM